MIRVIRGVRDILPGEAVQWQSVEAEARRIFGLYGFHELRTPIMERTELFARAVGETSDIVEKEMYSFPDRKGASISLRPEGTASVVRSFMENGFERQLPWKVFYMGPMFRYERPQKGRYRQFHQIGCELFGPQGPLADAEMMAMAMRYLGQIGLAEGLTLELNSLGCPACRPAYREKLTSYLESKKEALCGHCQSRMDRNPLRILDCKTPGCREIAQSAPHMKEHLCDDCQSHFDGLLAHLDGMQLPYQINPLMVRGLDYYNRTAFEITTGDLGAQNAVAAGGRYDRLVADMGGRAMPAIGFAMGVERLVLLLGEQNQTTPPAPSVYMVVAGPEAEAVALAAAESIRGADITLEVNLQGGGMRNQMKKAARSGAAITVIIGDHEAAQKVAQCKVMESGEQQEISLADLPERLKSDLK
ncbi:MAG: histidine--tRNA ligase [Magnetococcales bacterium]|nr:histidine--tRNA ligase [Magnetococcales bacterium]